MSGDIKVHERESNLDENPNPVLVQMDKNAMCSNDEFDEYCADMILQLARKAARLGRRSISE